MKESPEKVGSIVSVKLYTWILHHNIIFLPSTKTAWLYKFLQQSESQLGHNEIWGKVFVLQTDGCILEPRLNCFPTKYIHKHKSDWINFFLWSLKRRKTTKTCLYIYQDDIRSVWDMNLKHEWRSCARS